MANAEHLAILRKGVPAWNRWMLERRRTSADPREPNLSGADLKEAPLGGARLGGVNLIAADLRGALLHSSDLCGAFLGEARLSGADLRWANLGSADLFRVDFAGATVGRTIFANNNLSTASGLETVKHQFPSTIGVDVIYNSRGRIPEIFLRGAGVPESLITCIPSLVGDPIEYYSCFISHSSKDHEFAARLREGLRAKGVRCWFAPEDMKIGDRIRDRIDESIRLHDKLLLVLSEHSVVSPWVRREVEAAREREDRQKGLVLFPIRLDDAVERADEAWAREIKQRHIGEFADWKNHDSYQKAFDKLLRDLKDEAAKGAGEAG